MKKIVYLFLTLSLVILLTACGEGTTESTSYDEDAALEKAKSQSTDMVSGDFSTTANNFNEDISKQLDEQKLKQAWESVVAEIGEYVGFYSATTEVIDNYLVATVILEFQFNAVIITTTYDSDEKIAGINLNYFTIEKDPVSNENFEEHAVTIGEEYPLDGILTLPKNAENPPVVLIVHGSGPTDKNGTVFSNTPLQDIAHQLAEQGIASLRYDKRYYSYPEQAAILGADLTLEDEVLEDVNYAIDLLSNETRIDSSNIFVLGHSLGGSLAPYIAHSNDVVKGIISVAGTLRPIYELSYDQNKALAETILNGDYDDATIDTITSQMEQVEIDIQILRNDLSEIPDDQILLGAAAGYQKSVKEYAGENYIDDINIPTLVLQGSADFQVSATVDYPLWQTALQGNDLAEFHLYENLNHLMMPTSGKQDLSEYEVKNTVSSEVIDDIASFINNHTH